MLKMKNYTVRVPINITLESIRELLLKSIHPNDANNKILIDKMLFVVSEIFRVQMNSIWDDNHDDGMAHLQAKYLKANLSRSGGVTYKQVIDRLIEIDLIIVNNSYRTLHYSKGYSIKDFQYNLSFHQVPLETWTPKPRVNSIESTPTGEKIIDQIRTNIAEITVDRKYIDFVNKAQINLYAIWQILYNVDSKIQQTSKRLENNTGLLDIYITSDDFGRVHHNITSIGKKYRPAFKIMGEDIWGVDVSGSQLFFIIKKLVAFSKMKANSKDWNVVCQKLPDVPLFIENVLSGKFYISIGDHLDMSEEELKANKIQTLMPIFSKKDPKRKTKYLKALEAIYPTLMGCINTMKKDDYTEAAKYLQREESSVMINNVCDTLIKKGIWFVPVHDCILTQKENIQLVQDAIVESCEKYNGFRPHVKISNWTGVKTEKAIGSSKEIKQHKIDNILDQKKREKMKPINSLLREKKQKNKIK
jgi:hypothetical protein